MLHLQKTLAAILLTLAAAASLNSSRHLLAGGCGMVVPVGEPAGATKLAVAATKPVVAALVRGHTYTLDKPSGCLYDGEAPAAQSGARRLSLRVPSGHSASA